MLTLMKKKFDVEKEIRGLKPTLKVDRSSLTFLSHEITSWDFGGQKTYRDEYLKHKDRYLAGVDLVYYVVDVQDVLRFDEAMDYFKEVMSYFKENNLKIPVVIMLHKVDIKLVDDPTIQDNIVKLKTRFQEFLPDFKMKFFTTTIQQLQTVVHAFSSGISMLYTQTDALNKFMLDIVNKMKNVMALLLFEQSGISVAEYYLEHITLAMKRKILTLFEIAERRIMQRNVNTYEFSDRLDAFTKVSGLIQVFEIDGMKFFVLLVVEEHDEEEVINQFNFFEEAYAGVGEIIKTLLEDEPEKQSMLNPNH